MSTVTPVTKRVTMLPYAKISQKTSGGFGNLYIDDKQENGGRIGIGILYSVSHHLQKSDRVPAGLRKRS